MTYTILDFQRNKPQERLSYFQTVFIKSRGINSENCSFTQSDLQRWFSSFVCFCFMDLTLILLFLTFCKFNISLLQGNYYIFYLISIIKVKQIEGRVSQSLEMAGHFMNI